MSQVELFLGDCRAAMLFMPDNSVDSVVTDPPYGLSDQKPADVVACLSSWLAGEEYRPNKRGFMGKEWDAWVPGAEVWREVFRVLKPGGHVIAFAGTRTHDLMSIAMRLAGFECRDTIMDLYATGEAARTLIDSLTDAQRKVLAAVFPADVGVLWTYGSGFPKSMDVSKALAKVAGEDMPEGVGCQGDRDTLVAAWEGWGTALKPAFEPALLFRKPLVGTVAENVLTNGTGALNIDACRVPLTGDADAAAFENNHRVTERLPQSYDGQPLGLHDGGWKQRTGEAVIPPGRWPANLIHDGSDEVLAAFPSSASPWIGNPNSGAKGGKQFGGADQSRCEKPEYRDAGSAARFFYCAKASRADRGEGNTHPTVKPTALGAYLIQLVTPPGGTTFDLYAGSGSFGVAAVRHGFNYIGCDTDPGSIEIARRRIAREIAEKGGRA